MSLVRVGLAETKNFADGYEAIFGKKSDSPQPPPAPQAPADDSTAEATTPPPEPKQG